MTTATMKIISLFLMCFGIKFQKPVRRIKAGRSLKYRIVCKALAGSGKKRKSSKKWGSAKPKYVRKPGR